MSGLLVAPSADAVLCHPWLSAPPCSTVTSTHAAFGSVRLVVTAGETLPAADPASIRGALRRAQCSTGSDRPKRSTSSYPITKDEAAQGRPALPSRGYEVKLLDDEDKEVDRP